MISVLLSPKLWIALAIAAAFALTHHLGSKSGQAKVQAKWDAQNLLQLKAAQEANRENRNTEAARSRNVIDAQNASVTRAAVFKDDANRSRAESLSLRDDLSALRLRLPTLTREAVGKYADAAAVVFDNCQRSYQELAGKADGHANDSLMLQQAWPTDK